MILLLEEIQSWNTEAHETRGLRNGRQRNVRLTKWEATKREAYETGGNREATLGSLHLPRQMNFEKSPKQPLISLPHPPPTPTSFSENHNQPSFTQNFC